MIGVVRKVPRKTRAVRKVAKVAKILAKLSEHKKGVSKIHAAAPGSRMPSVLSVDITTRCTGEAPQHQQFVLRDGRHIRSLFELVDELETMNDDIFHHHVAKDRNDFANWTRDVFDEKHLADEMEALHHRVDVQRAVLKHLVRELRRQQH